MTDPRPPRPGASSRGHWLLICLLLTPAIVVPLLVPLYDRADPTLAGFPFFYWAQLAMIPGAVALTVAAYYIAKAADRRDRSSQRGGDDR